MISIFSIRSTIWYSKSLKSMLSNRSLINLLSYTNLIAIYLNICKSVHHMYHVYHVCTVQISVYPSFNIGIDHVKVFRKLMHFWMLWLCAVSVVAMPLFAYKDILPNEILIIINMHSTCCFVCTVQTYRIILLISYVREFEHGISVCIDKLWILLVSARVCVSVCVCRWKRLFSWWIVIKCLLRILYAQMWFFNRRLFVLGP